MTNNNYDGPLYAPWDKVVEGRGFDPVEARKENQAVSAKESVIEETTENVVEKEPDYLVPVLMLLSFIFVTLCIIVAGYLHGKMNIGAVWHNLNNFY
jgi:hypothetical protein